MQVKEYFKEPSEVKRLRKGSWQVNMRTLGGRQKILDNILEGKRHLSEY